MSEQDYAMMEGEMVAAVDGYIAARPQLDSVHNRRIYEAGFKAAYSIFESKLSAMQQRAEAAEARIKASQEQEPVAFIYPAAYGSRASLCRENKPADWGMGDDDSEWYENPLYAAPVIPPDVAELQRKLDELEQAAQDEIDRLVEAQKLVLSNKLAEAKSNSDRYKFLRRISDEPELIELLNAADENPKSPDDFDAAIDKAMLAAALQPGGSNE